MTRCESRAAPDPAITTTSTLLAQNSATNGQLPPAGPHAAVDVLLVGALLWSAPADAADVLHLVHDDDLADPAAGAVLAAARSLVDAGKPAGPQLVLDELRRIGALRPHVAERLRDATTSGACPQAARHYGAAVVAEALRRRVESAGYALSTAAGDVAESELAPMVAGAAAAVADCAHRLEALRGESL